jgi:nitroreductase
VGGNGAAVRSAPVVAVFAADLEPRRLLAATLARERSAGLTPARYLRGFETDAAALLAGPACGGGGGGGGAGADDDYAAGGEARARAGAVSPLAFALHGAALEARRGAAAALSAALAGAAPVPTLNSAEGWAFKNAALAAQTLMLGAAAAGLASLPLEGFDARMACAALGIPWPRYAVPLAVALGYAAQPHAPPPSSRPPPQAIFSLDAFGAPFPFEEEEEEEATGRGGRQ